MFIYIQLIQQALALKMQLVLTHIYCVIKVLLLMNSKLINNYWSCSHLQFFSVPTLILQLAKLQKVVILYFHFIKPYNMYLLHVVHGVHACTVLNDLWVVSCHDQSYRSYSTVACLCLPVQWLELIKNSGLHYSIYLIFYIHNHIASYLVEGKWQL